MGHGVGHEIGHAMGGAMRRAAGNGDGGGTPKKGTSRLSPCSALGDALQRAYQVQHKNSGESLVVRTFNGSGLLTEMLQRNQKCSSVVSTDDDGPPQPLAYEDDDDENEDDDDRSIHC